MVQSRSAVPVWIMPLSRVVENFDPTQVRFDVVIIDEASQSDVMALIALYLGKQVVIVGDVIQGTVLGRSEIDRQIERYRATDAEGRRTIVGLQPARAEVILAGACIVRTIMDSLGCGGITVSDHGLRHGVLIERFGTGGDVGGGG